jgi:hypothetical protein
VVDGRPIVEMQVKVCKGALTSGDLLEMSAELGRDEWGEGPGLGRVELATGESAIKC